MVPASPAGQRMRNRQPECGSTGERISPCNPIRSRRNSTSGSGDGATEIRAVVDERYVMLRPGANGGTLRYVQADAPTDPHQRASWLPAPKDGDFPRSGIRPHSGTPKAWLMWMNRPHGQRTSSITSELAGRQGFEFGANPFSKWLMALDFWF